MGIFEDEGSFKITTSTTSSFGVNGQSYAETVDREMNNFGTPKVHKTFKKTVVRIDENGNKTVEEFYSDGDGHLKALAHKKKKCAYCGAIYEKGEQECECCGAKQLETIE